MNFKNLLLFSILTLSILSCGVKGPPTAPKHSEIPSYIEKFHKDPKGQNINSTPTDKKKIPKEIDED